MSMKNLYEQEILDHYQNPRNFGLLPEYNCMSPMYNPSCGDSVTICGVIEDGKMMRLSFEGKGCVLSLAMASRLTEFVIGERIEEILQYDDELVEKLLKMPLGLKRMQCGLLSIEALQKAVMFYQRDNAIV